jgi:hypothetical protein
VPKPEFDNRPRIREGFNPNEDFMSFVISKDMGQGNPPAFWTMMGFGALQNAREYNTEAEAQAVIDGNDALTGCIVMPNDEILMTATNEKSVEVLSGMKTRM